MIIGIYLYLGVCSVLGYAIACKSDGEECEAPKLACAFLAWPVVVLTLLFAKIYSD